MTTALHYLFTIGRTFSYNRTSLEKKGGIKERCASLPSSYCTKVATSLFTYLSHKITKLKICSTHLCSCFGDVATSLEMVYKKKTNERQTVNKSGLVKSIDWERRNNFAKLKDLFIPFCVCVWDLKVWDNAVKGFKKPLGFRVTSRTGD